MHEFKQRCYAKEGNKINKYTPSKEQTSGSKGRKVGIAYELENG